MATTPGAITSGPQCPGLKATKTIYQLNYMQAKNAHNDALAATFKSKAEQAMADFDNCIAGKIPDQKIQRAFQKR